MLRHSNGSRCQITVAVDGGLVVTVADDGQADPLWLPGVGLRSIMDRAEELGASAMAGPVPNGWQVCARIPLLADQTAGDQAESTGFAAD